MQPYPLWHFLSSLAKHLRDCHEIWIRTTAEYPHTKFDFNPWKWVAWTNFHYVTVIFVFISFWFSSSRAYATMVDRFWRSVRVRHISAQGCAVWRCTFDMPPTYGVKYQKLQKGGMNSRFQATLAQCKIGILSKLLYCVDSAKFWTTVKTTIYSSWMVQTRLQYPR